MGDVEDFGDRVRRGAPPDLDAESEPVRPERPRLLADAFVAANDILSRGKPEHPVRTGFVELDAGIRHYGPKEVTMLAADSGIGKSTLATQAALFCGSAGIGVAYFNLEMSEEMYGLRTASNFCSLPTKKAAAGELTDEERVRLTTTFEFLRRAASHITLGNAQEHRNGKAIKAECERAAKYLDAVGAPMKLIVIDHVLQVMVKARSDDKDGAGKERADLLKDLAETFGCHVLALVHINREGSKTGKMPTKNQIASSEWFNRHADNILIFHQRRSADGTFAGDKATLSCQKARWGEPFAVELAYEKGFFYPWSFVR